MKTYYSKIDWWAYAIFIAPAIPLFINLLLKNESETDISFCLFLLCYAIYIFFFPIRYVLADDFLEIRCGLFLNGKIPYKNMRGICECKMSLLDKAPTLSRDCVRIGLDTSNINPFFLANDFLMNPKKHTLVSPYKKAEFISELNEKLAQLNGK